jgi:hypothetical protein
MPPFGILIVTYLACGGLLWIIAYLLAPIGYQISLARGIGAVFLMTVFSLFSSAFLKPAIGDARVLIELIIGVAIVKSVLRLPLSRSFATVLIYWVTLVTAVYFLFTRPERAQRRSALEVRPSAAITVA